MAIQAYPQIEEYPVARPSYKIIVPTLIDNLESRDQLVFDDKAQSPAMFLVRACGLAPGTAYKAINPDKADGIDLNTAWAIFAGIRSHELTVDFGDGERPIQWSDVVQIIDE